MVSGVVWERFVGVAAGDVKPSRTRRSGEPSTLRLVGAGIAGVGLAVLMHQIIPAPTA